MVIDTSQMVREYGADNAHTIHSYFNTCPESPDGHWVLYFRSTRSDGQLGDIIIQARDGVESRILDRDIETEDAHRVACQQWTNDGRTIVYHRFRGNDCEVCAVDPASGDVRVLVADRLVGWGRPNGRLVPIYRPHWKLEGDHDLELLDVETGDIKTVLPISGVAGQYPDWVAREFGDGKIAAFLPCLSPDGSRVFFKIARPQGGNFRSAAASKREGLIVFDLERRRISCMFEKWGHPAWLPDSQHILNVPNSIQDSVAGSETRIPGLPVFPGSHPSAAPDGLRFATDVRYTPSGNSRVEWGIVVAPFVGDQHRVVCRIRGSAGITSWRPPHPHPVFSADGKRLYFNDISANWTKMYAIDLESSSARN